MEKIFNQKNFINFIWSPLGSTGNLYINFCLQVHFQLSAADIVPIICHRCQWHRCQQHKGKWWLNLPPVSLTPVVHLELRISQRIFEKIRNDPNVIIRGLGEGDSWKKPEAKNLVTLSFKGIVKWQRRGGGGVSHLKTNTPFFGPKRWNRRFFAIYSTRVAL